MTVRSECIPRTPPLGTLINSDGVAVNRITDGCGVADGNGGSVAMGFYSGRRMLDAEVRMLQRAEPPKPVIVWVVCDWRPSSAISSVGGVFATEAEADAACTSSHKGIGPIELGKRMPHAEAYWPGFYYPRIPGSREHAEFYRVVDEQRQAAVYAAEQDAGESGDLDDDE